MELNGDWLAQALALLENARKEVRLTLPPGQARAFWTQVLERARLIPVPLTIDVLLPNDPLTDPGLSEALDVLLQLDQTRHTVSVSASSTPIPWFVMIGDRDRALAAVGDAYNGDDLFLVQAMADPARIADLRASFERRFDRGERDPDLAAWRAWLDRFPTRREARAAVKQLERGQERLADVSARVLRRIPKRRFWVIKPGAGAWGMPEREGLPFEHWFHGGRLHLGWPALADLFSVDADPTPDDLIRALADRYPDVEDAVRVRATARMLLREMCPGDRVVAMDGWTVAQEAPVQTYGWGQVMSEAERLDSPWPWTRAVQWRTAELEVPVATVRETAGLQSATYPLHRLTAPAWRTLVDAIEARRNKAAPPQMSLTLDLFPPLRESKQQDA